jgi:hypothetical protein
LVDLILLFINFLSLEGCQLFGLDGVEIVFQPSVPTFVEPGSIADNQPPGLLYTFTIAGISSVDPGMA